MWKCLEQHELLLNVADDLERLHLENVESHSLREGSALSDGHDVSDLDSSEAGGAVS